MQAQRSGITTAPTDGLDVVESNRDDCTKENSTNENLLASREDKIEVRSVDDPTTAATIQNSP